jgi:hypothetical protein
MKSALEECHGQSRCAGIEGNWLRVIQQYNSRKGDEEVESQNDLHTHLHHMHLQG